MHMRRRGRIRQLFLDHPDRGVGLERQVARKQPVEQHAGRVQVRARIDFVRDNLFGRHVRRRSHHVAIGREVLRARDPRDAKVHDFHAAVIVDHHVGGFEITMHDAGGVRVLERAEHQSDQVGRALRGQRPTALRELIQRFAPHQFHHHQQVLVGSEDLVNRGNLGMIQAGQCGGFRAEALHDLAVAQLGVQDLDGDLTFECLVHRLVNGAHAAASQALNETILADGPSDHADNPGSAMCSGKKTLLQSRSEDAHDSPRSARRDCTLVRTRPARRAYLRAGTGPSSGRPTSCCAAARS